ncbi:MAG: ABC transporter ATP-binding protein [Rhizobiales bacterium]|nr:ABC transporter ATP-binding protein [Hyphomicrobiales bacterium]
MNDPIIIAKDINKVLGSGAGQVHALKNVNLSLRGGEVTMLMGPSGSGKTTLLSVLGCMLAPTSGTVQVCGVASEGANAEQLAKLRREHIGFVFQTYHLFPTMSAVENVQLALDVRGLCGRIARAKAHDALEKVGLAHKLCSYPLELSGGEQQRVAIARAIVSDPSAILADEPTGALDGCNGQAIMSILATIAADSDRSVLVVTHDSRLTSFADRIIFIEDGRLVDEQVGNARAPKRRTAALAGH